MLYQLKENEIIDALNLSIEKLRRKNTENIIAYLEEEMLILLHDIRETRTAITSSLPMMAKTMSAFCVDFISKHVKIVEQKFGERYGEAIVPFQQTIRVDSSNECDILLNENKAELLNKVNETVQSCQRAYIANTALVNDKPRSISFMMKAKKEAKMSCNFSQMRESMGEYGTALFTLC